VIAGPLSSVLAACGDDGEPTGTPDDTPVETGLTAEQVKSATGQVSILSWEWYQVDDAQVPSGINAKWAYLATNEDTITKTQQAGAFDVIGIFQGQLVQLRSLDRIEPIDTSLLSNWSGMDQMFQDTEVVRSDGQVYAVPFQWGYAYFVYDRGQTAEPTSFDFLKSADLKGKIGVPDDPYAVITTFASLNGFETPNQLMPDQFEQLLDSMNEFKPQLRTIYTYGEAPQLLSREDIAIAFPEFGPTVLAAQDAGADAELTLLNAWSYVDCLMIVRGTTNLAGSYRWIDQSIGEPAQAATSEQSLAFPIVQAAVTVLPKPLQYSAPDEILSQAPLLPGVPITDADGYVPYQEWLNAWNEYKA
jgi:spermidine/putrescine-binding protein